MMTLNLEDNPVQTARDIVLAAFNPNRKNRRACLRVVQQVLNLAAERGYRHSEEFSSYFRREDMQSPSGTDRLMRNLFEYVSPDEIKQLARIYRV